MAESTDRQDDRVPRRRRRRAGGADRAVEGGRGGRRHARARSRSRTARSRRSTTSTRPTRSRSTRPSPRPTRPTTTGSCCRAASPTRTSCAPTRTPSRFVRAFFEQAKPVGVICHGPWTLVEADVAAGPHDHVVAVAEDRHRERGRRPGSTRRSTSTRASTSSRNPDDLPAFCAKIVEEFAEGKHAGQRASVGARMSAARGDPGHRRHARRHELPPRGRLVPGVPPARVRAAAVTASTGTSGWAATSWSPPSPARASTREHGDDVRDAERAQYRRADRRRSSPSTGARALLEDAQGARATRVVLASSAKPDEVEHYLDLLDARDAGRRLDGPPATSSGPSPSPTWSSAAVREGRAAARRVMMGDSTWDCKAAKRGERADDRRADRRLLRAGAARGRRACVVENSGAAR